MFQQEIETTTDWACAFFAEGHYRDAIPLFLHLAKQKPDMPFYQEMAKSALEAAGVTNGALQMAILSKLAARK